MSAAPSEPQVFFARAVIARLAVWPVLRVAVDSGWGGPESKQKRTWMAGEIIDAFGASTGAASDPDETYIEELLLQMMADEFDCMVEDYSGEDVARDIIRLREDFKSGRIEESMKHWEERERAIGGKKVEYTFTKKGDDTDWVDDDEEGSGEDGEDEDEEMEDEEVPQLIEHSQKKEPVIDEDGFTLVQGKGKGQRRG